MNLSSRSITTLVGAALLLTASICFAQSSSPGKPIDLKALQDAYAKAIQKVEGDSASAAQSLPTNYIKALQAIQQAAKKAGDLEGLTAANRELERFKADQTVPDQPDASTPDAIKKLQTEYKAATAKNDMEKNKKIVSITKQYLENLNSLQTDLTKNDTVDKALNVNAEIKRVNADSKFTSAQFALAATDTDKQPAKTDTQPTKPSVVVLSARDAQLHGKRLKYDAQADAVKSWIDSHDYLTWTTPVALSGKYTVEIKYACEFSQSGSEFAFIYKDQSVKGTTLTLKGKIIGTGTWGNVMVFPLGDIRLPHGNAEFTLKALKKPGYAVMDLYSITIRPSDQQP
jgi:hypothetical protein